MCGVCGGGCAMVHNTRIHCYFLKPSDPKDISDSSDLVSLLKLSCCLCRTVKLFI